MPRIFDNIELPLLQALQQTLELSNRADFCVGYFNLRGWRQLDSYIEEWSGEDSGCCRLLIGMQRLPSEDLRTTLSLSASDNTLDQQTAHRLKKRLAQEFKEQLTLGVPTNEDEIGLRRLARQIRARKVRAKLFLGHPLHAKLYLLFREDTISPIVGYLGSSNLTLAGLSKQGELNVDVLDSDACEKLQGWFEDRWNDRWCLDISEELAQIIDESWARETPLLPYHIYLKMIYHLSREARAGISEFRIPKDFGNRLFRFQVAAVQIAAHHLNNRGGVLIGDVVGLGKTLMATAVAKIFEDDYGLETLILCPKNLVEMWEEYAYEYRLRAKILPVSRAINDLPNLRRHRIVIIDESHNLRNREGKRFRAIQEYIAENESKVILLTATPYNKTYTDLSSQLRLFIADEDDLGVRPEQLLRKMGETELLRLQCPVRSIAAFEKSEYADDWRNLMRLYLVRRDRTFIRDNYAQTDPADGRQFLVLDDGTPSYFPDRIPKKVPFTVGEEDEDDQYARLYATEIVDTINELNLPRYGLGNYLEPSPHEPPTQQEAKILSDLSRAGKRLMGFCRTNLFKRLESCGHAFIQSIERHILRNYIFLHAIENDLSLPIGPQDAELLDPGVSDTDVTIFSEDEDAESAEESAERLCTPEDYSGRAAQIYEREYAKTYRRRFKWLPPRLFIKELADDLRQDAESLLNILQVCGEWQPDRDAKLDALEDLLTNKHRNEKLVVFTQFADTVNYLTEELQKRGIAKLAGVTGDTTHLTRIVRQFSPRANEKRSTVPPEKELRILIATDILSEGLNLQDCHIVVNFDLPWALIRLTQRAGRVDRIGQTAENILCYSFLPAEGVERIIRLRGRLRQRLRENAEVIGTDEAFFEDEENDRTVRDLYNEKSGLMDGAGDPDTDLASQAYQIWQNAIAKDPRLEKIISELPPVVYSARLHEPDEESPAGVLVYLRTADDSDALAWVNGRGEIVSESPVRILEAAKCSPDTSAVQRAGNHHDLVKKAAEHIIKEERSVGGQLGRPSGARFRTYERLKNFIECNEGSLFVTDTLRRAVQEIHDYPLRQSATDALNRQLRAGISDEALAELVVALRDEGRLCIIHEEKAPREPQIICSLGLAKETAET